MVRVEFVFCNRQDKMSGPQVL